MTENNAARRASSPPERFGETFTLSGTEKVLVALLALAATAVIGLFVALSFFDYPSADDFCVAAKAQQLGFLEAQAFWYQNWSGRYTLNAVWTGFMLLGDVFHTYRYPPVVLLLSTWLSLGFLIGNLGQGRIALPQALLAGGIGTVLFISGVPDPAQTFYWLGGSFTYQLANIFLIGLLGLLVWRETAHGRAPLKALAFLPSGLLVVAIVGLNEISSLLTLAILGGGAFYAPGRRRDARLFWVGLLLTGIAAASISVTAPGNYQRFALEQDAMLRPAPGLAALLYLPWVALRLLYWLSNLGLWAAAVTVLAVTFQAARARLYAGGEFKKPFLLVPAFWLGSIFALNAIGFLINRYPLPERAESVLFLLFLLGWFPSFVILAHFLIGETFEFGARRLLTPALALVLVSALGTPNVFEAYKDVYRGYRYDREIRQRLARIETLRQQGQQDLVIDSLSRPPRTVFATDITTDPGNFRNQCTSAYYRLRSIRLGSPARP